VMWHDFGEDDRCKRCGVRYARRTEAGLRSPSRDCQPRWARVLNAIRAERNDAAEARAELEDERETTDGYAAAAEAGRDLAAALRVALGTENVFDESHELFQIRRLIEKVEDVS
jgi:hypothetical protein